MTRTRHGRVAQEQARGSSGDSLGKIVLEEHEDRDENVTGTASAGSSVTANGTDEVAGRALVESAADAKRRADEEQARKDRTAVVQESQADRLRMEMDALMEAKHALASDPARALSLAQNGERTFGKSILSQERQHVLILALIGVGRLGDAQRLAAPYLQNHPGSPFAKRVQRALDAAKAR